MNREKGFTLIELLMVVAIIGILTATAVPAYRTVRQRAVATEAATLLRHLLDAQVGYYLEYDKFFPENGKKSMDIFSMMTHPRKRSSKSRMLLELPSLWATLLTFIFKRFPKRPMSLPP
jgi:prepilin-type N-terminal cleavage/methylation domain-containing protein